MSARARVDTEDEPPAAAVSVVVTTYNRVRRLPAVLAPLLRDPGTLEVIVVVDGSTDGSVEWLEAQARREPRLRYVVTSNVGGGKARQVGVDHARGGFILFLDDDVIAGEGMVSGHRRRHGITDGLIVVGYMPISRRPSGSSRWIVDRYARRYEQNRELWENEPDRILEHLWAGNLSLSRTSIAAMGGFQPGVRLNYHADLVVGLRAHDAGLRGVFAPELVAEHRYERNLDGFCRECFNQGFTRAMLCDLYPERWGSVSARGIVGTPPLTSRLYGLAALTPARQALVPLLRRTIGWASAREHDRLRAYTVRLLVRIETAAGIRAGLRRDR